MYEARVRGGKLFPFCNWLLIRLLERRKRGGTEKERVSEKGGEEREERRSRRRERERETETQRERAQDYSKSKGTGEIDLRRKSGKCERGMRKTRLEVHTHTHIHTRRKSGCLSGLPAALSFGRAGVQLGHRRHVFMSPARVQLDWKVWRAGLKRGGCPLLGMPQAAGQACLSGSSLRVWELRMDRPGV